MPLLGDIFTRGRGGHPLTRRHFVFRRFLRDRRASVGVDNVFLFWRKYEKKMRRKWRTKPPYGEITAIRKWRLCIRGMFPVTLVLSFPLRAGWELSNAVYPPYLPRSILKSETWRGLSLFVLHCVLFTRRGTFVELHFSLFWISFSIMIEKLSYSLNFWSSISKLAKRNT